MQKFHIYDCHFSDLGGASDSLFCIGYYFVSANQKQFPDLGSVMLWISMEFLGLFLRCHFAGKLVVTSQNVGCFLRLFRRVLPEFDSHLELRIFSVFAGDQILFLF